ncbi:hypothetical protein ACFPYI_13605 [Halomarina salina]|uniref:DUF8006 domain-containing protein n=1 Tax=Halomarina salina TaxID=1872699 RepID=A0ABD5RNZ8_9EURY|nr:hypothetical protein [Halomarina salina]
MYALPLQVVDSFLQQYHMGQVFLALFAVGLLGTLPLKSKVVTGLHIIAFGLLFILTPLSMMGNAFIWRFVGIALVFVGPMLVISSK